MPKPDVSIVIPVLNEERHLAQVVKCALAQNYDGALEVVLAVGPSQDRTEAIAAELAEADSRVKVVANPSGRTPDAMNAGLAAASGEILVRCDGHALLPADYVDIAVATLQRTGAVNTGGIMDAQGESDFQRAVAWCMKSRVGVGSAAFHVGGVEGPAETVYLGCFRTDALRAVGGYDSKMTRAQDWELNHRLIDAGGLIWFNPALRVTYRPRNTLRALASQYRQYGQWRRKVMRMHPETTRRLSALRYFAPPVALVANILGLVGGGLGIAAGSAFGGLLVIPAAYALALIAAATTAIRSESVKVALIIPIALATMHMNWGYGFLTSKVD